MTRRTATREGLPQLVLSIPLLGIGILLVVWLSGLSLPASDDVHSLTAEQRWLVAGAGLAALGFGAMSLMMAVRPYSSRLMITMALIGNTGLMIMLYYMIALYRVAQG